MKELGFRRLDYDYCLYIKQDVVLVLFVDDGLITGAEDQVQELVDSLHEKFLVKDLGTPSSFLGMQITHTKNGLHLSQSKMIDRLQKDFAIENCRSIKTPMEVNFNLSDAQIDPDSPNRKLVCSLMYLAVTTRPDISYSVLYLSRYLDKPTHDAWTAGKRILRYLCGTRHLGLPYNKGSKPLEGKSDSDWGGDRLTRKSVSGFICFHAGNPIAWHSKKQNCVALSTMEAEYIAAGSAAQELVNLRGVLSDLGGDISDGVSLKVDNVSAISMMCTFTNSKRGKHIEIKHHFIKDLCLNKVINIEYISSNDNVADIFTKSLGAEKFEKFRSFFLN
uniref:Copia protein n=1 Tax=Lygus hesperus TaxID=30085 RepID=A0A0A9XQL0_LYGHE